MNCTDWRLPLVYQSIVIARSTTSMKDMTSLSKATSGSILMSAR